MKVSRNVVKGQNGDPPFILNHTLGTKEPSNAVMAAIEKWGRKQGKQRIWRPGL